MQAKLSKKSKFLNSKNKNNKSRIDKYLQNYPYALNPFYVYKVFKLDKEEESKIIECKALIEEPLSPKNYIYYIHYYSYNRRMDEWVSFDKLKITENLTNDFEEERRNLGFNSDDEHEGLDMQDRIAHEETTRLKTINRIKVGKYYTDTWYYSQFPEGYHFIETLFFCEFCLNFFIKEEYLFNHLKICQFFYPPGNEIYNDPKRNISVFEIDGFKNEVYCENLSYLSKLFLDHKNLYLSINIFLFYVLTENDEYGYHIVGYFSKYKDLKDLGLKENQDLNLSCILTFPFHQRKGYGKFLINFSYELSRIENKMGTPERPLSDLGRQSYISFWSQKIIEYLLNLDDFADLTIEKISKITFIKDFDIIDTLERIELMKKKNEEIYLNLDKKFLKTIYQKMGRPAIPVMTDRLHWTKYKN